MKRFNPKKCPYEQLLKHRGSAILYVDAANCSISPRIRVTSSTLIPDSDGCLAHSVYDFSGLEGSLDLSQSCFAYYRHPVHNDFRPTKYTETIKKMKKYDRRIKLKIRHIEFYEESVCLM